MSTGSPEDVEVAVVGAGVVGSAVALALARRGVLVAVLEAAPEPALGASATNSGILHMGFDSAPEELETELLVRSAALRPAVLRALEVPLLQCGAVMKARDVAEQETLVALARNAEANGVPATLEGRHVLAVPGEAVTDPVAYTYALLAAAERQCASVRTCFEVVSIERSPDWLALISASGERVRARLAINCAGLEADTVASLVGDHSFEIYPRKGEFLVFAQPSEQRLEQILLPVPSRGTRGVLVFPTIDGMVVAGPTAVDQEDKHDWSVRPEARAEILAKASGLYPPLVDAEPVFSYAGLRPAGRDANYIIGPSAVCDRLVNVAAIRSTGLSASLGIAARVAELVEALGVELGPERELKSGTAPSGGGSWWRRTAEYRARARA
jgi:glycerol-3-phosphate dehydrogenase